MLIKGLMASALRAALVLAIFTVAALPALAQDTGTAEQKALTNSKDRALVAIQSGSFGDAATILAELVKRAPNDGEARVLFSWALVGKSKQTDDPELGKLLAAQALAEAKKGKELGVSGDVASIADTIIKLFSLEANASDGPSKNPEANKLMSQAEGYYTRSDYDRAFEFYQKALAIDPTIYEAALYSGDVMMQKSDFEASEKWYQQAIKIDPERETAYRYSATPLMKQKKIELARDRYIEAYITEPYNDRAIGGLVQWSRATGAKLGHPKFNIPEFSIGADGKAKSTISIGSLTDDGSLAWISYTSTRSKWHESKFKATFPNEKTYRHTLQEEVEALSSVVELAGDLKGKNKEIEQLKKLRDEGLLESFVLLARADQGIQADHLAYLRQNRAKLRQYVLNYVIQK